MRLRSTDADDESGQIVIARRVDVGQFGGFAADQRAADLVAGAGHAFDELLDDVGIDAAHGQVVEEEERLGAQGENVVDAVIDEVGADGGVDAGGGGDFQLGADAIGAGNQHGLSPALQVQSEERAEGADAAEDAARKSARGHAADALFGLVRARNIHTGIGVAHAEAFSGNRGSCVESRARKLKRLEQAPPAHQARMQQGVGIGVEALAKLARLPGVLRRLDGHIDHHGVPMMLASGTKPQ